MDEAGRGPWAGPVVAAAVILRRSRLSVRIDDSKRLTPAQRARAFSCIVKSAVVGVGIIGADEIDRVNILQATHRAMEQAVADLSTAPDLVLIDGTTSPTLPMPAWPIVHGDQRSYVISCASIIAKVVRDRLMAFCHELDPRYEFHRHKGYGTARHAAILAMLGPSLFHRRSFRPVTEAQALEVSAGR